MSAALSDTRRMRSLQSTVILLLIFLLSSSGITAQKRWWDKPSVRKKVRDQRQVLVVVSAQEHSHYRMTGVAAVRASRDKCLKQIMNFSEFEKISQYFKKVVHQPKHKRVYVILEALGYQARLLMQYETEVGASETVFKWTVVWGAFQGMIGSVHLKTIGAGTTEAVMLSSFAEKEVPLPRIFKSFVLEMIAHRVAVKMREHIESALTKGSQNGST